MLCFFSVNGEYVSTEIVGDFCFVLLISLNELCGAEIY